MRARGGPPADLRLACIDAPEIAQRPYGARARESLQKLATVRSEVTLEIQTRDRYAPGGITHPWDLRAERRGTPPPAPAPRPAGVLGVVLDRDGDGEACKGSR